jgi:hypothetical protein
MNEITIEVNNETPTGEVSTISYCIHCQKPNNIKVEVIDTYDNSSVKRIIERQVKVAISFLIQKKTKKEIEKLIDIKSIQKFVSKKEFWRVVELNKKQYAKLFSEKLN